ncbi:O-antigen ligase family protein [Bradyrhizobium sp. AUGA SZCCT0177]|uniref:O-antigen ligase family protein n=1 Tax=Bradyrhizobium sp. AUGA SZCCT0177 TaxID=2807665 RepID=UPI002011151C|nr:O-antigen ligase family protein [Bradyrhizobium sp. AUGA SZCCT0177]
MALSLSAIAIGLVAAWHIRHVRIHRRILTLLICLSVFVAASGLSFAVNAVGAHYTMDTYAAWYEIFRYAYLMMFTILFASVYRYPTFCLNVHRVYLLLLFLISAVGLSQYLTGNTVLVIEYDKFERVAGLSSHPVTYSMEMVLTFCVCELSRRKIRLAFNHFHIVVYALFLIALVLSASRTGVALLGVIAAIFLFVQRPALLPAFAAAFAVLLWMSPFGELFSDLRSVPDYVLRGEYAVWDPSTAPTSFHWRIHHWYYLSTLALERPLFGYGAGQVILNSPFSLLAHSQFVEIFFESGVVGLITYAVFWFSLPLAAMSDRRRLVSSYGKWSAEVGLLHLWLAMFAGVTLVASFDVSFDRETVAFSHLFVSMFVVLAQPRTVTKLDLGSRYSHVSMTASSQIEASGSREVSEPQPDRGWYHLPLPMKTLLAIPLTALMLLAAFVSLASAATIAPPAQYERCSDSVNYSLEGDSASHTTRRLCHHKPVQVQLHKPPALQPICTSLSIDCVVSQNSGYDTRIYPYGVKTYFSWYAGGPAATGNTVSPSDFASLTGWGQIYPQVGAPIVAANVYLKDYRVYVHLTSGGWQLVQDQATNSIGGQHYVADYSNNPSSEMGLLVQSDGSVRMNSPAFGYNNHFWIEPRGSYAPGTVNGVFSMAQLRTDNASANLIANFGGDWWRNTSAPYLYRNGVFVNNPGIGMGTWVKLTTTYQYFFFTTMTKSQLQAEPPPPLR